MRVCKRPRVTRLAASGLGCGLLVALAGCGSAASGPGASATPSATGSVVAVEAVGMDSAGNSFEIKSGLTVYFIPKDTRNQYELIADEGGSSALRDLGGTAMIKSGTTATPGPQIEAIKEAVKARADAIVIAANHLTALCPALAQAHAAGVKVVTFDSDVACPDHLFINQADTEVIGRSQVQLLAKQIGGKGEIAILSATATASNQNAWIAYMKDELRKYPGLKLVDIVYGDDDPATSLKVLQQLLKARPNLRGIISPTTVGISTAGKYLSEHKDVAARVTLTGLGLPSEMKPYVLDGTVKAFELWNPANMGVLAGYAAASLALGVTDGKPGSRFKAGQLGWYTVLPPSGSTGPSVILGPPTVFDAKNVRDFNF